MFDEYVDDEIDTLTIWTNSDSTPQLRDLVGLEEVEVSQGGQVYKTSVEGTGRLQGGDEEAL